MKPAYGKAFFLGNTVISNRGIVEAIRLLEARQILEISVAMHTLASSG